jgi:transposase InsO family protein
VTPDASSHRFRVRAFGLAHELGNVRAACRALGIHHSTFYRWRAQLLRFGPEVLRPRERGRPRMPNALSPLVEQRVVAFAPGHPGSGPARIAAELARPLWGGLRLSPHGVGAVLRRHGLNTRAKRLGLLAGAAAPPAPSERAPQPERHLDVERPGQLVQLDGFSVGRLSGTRGAVWQDTAIDVASAYLWADLQVTPRNPDARWTSALAHRVAADLARRGWRLEAVLTDNGSEFRNATFTAAVAALGARRRRIRAGRPQTNGCVERAQGTVPEACWKPAFARALVPEYTGLRRDLDRYLRYANADRAHTSAAPAAESWSSKRSRCGRTCARTAGTRTTGTAMQRGTSSPAGSSWTRLGHSRRRPTKALASVRREAVASRCRRCHYRALDLFVEANVPFGDASDVAYMEWLRLPVIYAWDADYDKIEGIRRREPEADAPPPPP